MSEKEMKIDFSGDRLLKLVEEQFAEGNPVDAIKLLNQHDEKVGVTAESLLLRANAYDDLGLYDRSISYHHAFYAHMDRYGDYPGLDEVTDSYNDMVGLFSSLGNTYVQTYYYKKMILTQEGKSSEGIAAEVAHEVFDKPDGPKFADEEDENNAFERIQTLIYADSIDLAIDELNELNCSEKNYLLKKTMLAKCYLRKKEFDKAIKCAKEVIAHHPADFEAGCILERAYMRIGKVDEAIAEVKRLIDKKPDSNNWIHDVAFAACDADMDSEAYELFRKLSSDASHECYTMFYYIVAAYNSGHYARSLELMSDFATIHDRSETAKYFLQLIRNNINNKGESEVLDRLEYKFQLPDEFAKPYLLSIEAYRRGENKKATKTIDECFNYALEYIFYEQQDDNALEFIDILNKNRRDDLLEEMCIDYKMFFGYVNEIICNIILRDEYTELAICRHKIYSYLKIDRLDIGSRYRKTFVTLYSDLVGKFNTIIDKSTEGFKEAVEWVYKRMEEAGTLSECKKSGLMICAGFFAASMNLKILAPILSVVESKYKVDHEKLLHVLGYTLETDPLNDPFDQEAKTLREISRSIQKEISEEKKAKEEAEAALAQDSDDENKD